MLRNFMIALWVLVMLLLLLVLSPAILAGMVYGQLQFAFSIGHNLSGKFLKAMFP